MELRIEIETFDKQVEFDLLEAENTISQGMERPIAEGITLRYEGTLFRKGVGFPDIIQIVIDVAEGMTIGIASGLISAWLYDKLKGRSVEKMRIERTEVILDKGEVQKIVTEKMKKERS